MVIDLFLKNLYQTIKEKDPAIHHPLEIILYPFFSYYIFEIQNVFDTYNI